MKTLEKFINCSCRKKYTINYKAKDEKKESICPQCKKINITKLKQNEKKASAPNMVQ